jgi:2,5-diketo-D-gluconate reductase A
VAGNAVNEEGVGRAVRASGLPREEVFVTTKMMPSGGDPERELAASLARLGIDDVDLHLIHWPTRASDGFWPDFERLRARGLARVVRRLQLRPVPPSAARRPGRRAAHGQ